MRQYLADGHAWRGVAAESSNNNDWPMKEVVVALEMAVVVQMLADKCIVLSF